MKNYDKLTQEARNSFINKVAQMSVEELNDMIINHGKFVNPPIVTLNETSTTITEITVLVDGKEIVMKSSDNAL